MTSSEPLQGHEEQFPRREQGCPLFLLQSNRCGLAPGGLPVSSIRIGACCVGEEYDGCPLFLAHLLRHSRPMFRGSLIRDFQSK